MVQVVKLQRPPSNQYVTASFVSNALTTHGKFAAYPHVNDVVLIKDMEDCPQDQKKQSVLLECGVTVAQCKFCLSSENTLVLLAMTTDGIQVWEPTEENRLVSVTIPFGSGGSPDVQDFSRGATIVKQSNGSFTLVVGGASGALHSLEADKYRFVYSTILEGFRHSSPISDVSSTHEPGYAEHTLPATCNFASVDEGGNLCVWDADTLAPIGFMKAPGESFTSVRLRGGLAFVGTLLGKICVFGLETNTMQAEICAHARSVSGLAMHPTVMTIASVSEDTHVNIWNLENVSMQELEPIASVAIKDKLLCGVSFCGEGGKDLLLCSYDVEALIKMPGDAVVG